jgi:RNA recognition motif-containing protein
MSRGPPSSRVYVGNLPEDIRPDEIGRIFDKYGRITDIKVKLPRTRGPAYAFVEFDNARAAQGERSCALDAA